MSNRLSGQTSPYLLQHAQNPVHWRPWDDAALAEAVRDNKPIFLSIGYSACHWCHVMEHESFEDDEIAERLNALFVCIKVDREERPDLDQIYMNAVQLMTGHGGWPMSVFLTPQLKPFFGGTYWPPRPAMGRPGFLQVVEAVADAWKERRELVHEQSEKLTERIREVSAPAPATDGHPRQDLVDAALGRLRRVFDPTHGGFGAAPKFPHPMDLQLLLRLAAKNPKSDALSMVDVSLDRMARGGIYDHLGGGFARYSVDARWLVPHFEKMLYDNALLTTTYLDAYRFTGNPAYRAVVEETLDYVLRDMTDAANGFHSAEDADSEGEEGKFYVWTPQQIRSLLGDERAERFMYVYDVSEVGNFEGANILNLPKTLVQAASLKQWDPEALAKELAEARGELLAARAQRVRPGKDDKVLASWNGLMIHAMAQAGAVLERDDYTAAAAGAASFVRSEMFRDGRLMRSYRAGKAQCDACLDDYANLCNALISLYQADWDPRWLEWAAALADAMLAFFQDAEHGGFFYTSHDHESLIARAKDYYDASTPSGNGMAATALIRLGTLTGRHDYLAAAERTLAMATGVMEQGAQVGQLYLALDAWLAPRREVVISGPKSESRAAARALQQSFLPYVEIAIADDGPVSEPLSALLAGKQGGDELKIHVCEQFACQAPLTSVAQALQALGGSDGGR